MDVDKPAPDFALPNLEGHIHRLSDYHGKIVIVNFWSCECPHSERTDRSMIDCLARWDGNVELLSIASNRNESVQSVEEVSKTRHLPGVLLDAEHVVADLYEAITTPHVFVVDRDGILRYRGAVDDMKFRQQKATRLFVKEAVESLLEGQSPTLTETLSYGCAIVREI